MTLEASELRSPELTWRPSRFTVSFALSLAIVLGVAFIPWWATRTALGLAIVGGAAAGTTLFGVVVARESEVFDAYMRFRCGRTGDCSPSILLGGIGRLRPETVVLAPVAVLTGLLFALVNGEPGPPAYAVLVLVSLALAVPLGVLGAYWRYPWFRVQWYLMLAVWCAADRRQANLLRAAENDPLLKGAADMSNQGIQRTPRALS